MNPAWSILLVLLIPPLSAEDRARIELAYDGRDHQEDAFVALVDHVRTWPSADLGDELIRLTPDLMSIVADPERFRGDLMRISGVLQQRSTLPSPHEGVDEWFVRLETREPALVYVVQPPADSQVREGRLVSIDARFYKRVEAVARDGQTRQYAAFVGRFPQIGSTGATDGYARLWIVAAPVTIMLLVFTCLFLYARKTARRTGTRLRLRATPDAPEEEDARPLPDDPADALAELRRRADAATDPPDAGPAA